MDAYKTECIHINGQYTSEDNIGGKRCTNTQSAKKSSNAYSSTEAMRERQVPLSVNNSIGSAREDYADRLDCVGKT